MKKKKNFTAWRAGVALAAVLAACGGAERASAPAGLPSPKDVKAVRDYIREGWTTLRRSHLDILKAAPDPKVEHAEGTPWVIWAARDADLAAIESELRQELGPEKADQLEIRALPESGAIEPHGLLYLPHPYVVPGGRFNEMYGWDSYFIQVGLLLDGELEMAKNMADNFIYEIQHYGTILNANRTYFLTRSQPPFLTEMILGVYEKTQDRDWLRSTLPAIDKYYKYWTTAPHLTAETGLSRYWDFGEGPAPEVVAGEKDESGKTHYDRIREYYRDHDEVEDYDLSLFYDRANDRLTDLFYKGDRSMRESGFDPSNRFGLFNVAVIFYNPVCLNSLLYRMETEAAGIHETLGDADTAKTWRDRAAARKQAIDKYLWDAETGLYFDYDFERKTLRRYEYATTFYPLWAGLASPEQASAVMGNLSRFEAPGGLLTSTVQTGNQWDAPFGWAPLQMLAVEGMIRYGFVEDARRVAGKFLSMVTEDFKEHGVIVEKYDVARRESQISEGIRFGYSSNEVGFGWTNAAYVDFARVLELNSR